MLLTNYFGDLSGDTLTSTGCSNSTRCVFGGIRNPGYTNTIEFITIASLGNSQDFGDQTVNNGGRGGAASSTRGVWAGGYGSPAFTNSIDYVEIPTTGNAIDFGDMTYTADRLAGCSNGHGGL